MRVYLQPDLVWVQLCTRYLQVICNLLLQSTYCAWKSIRTGSWLLMTLSVKSSWSWTLKETSLREMWGRHWGRVREAERKETRDVADWREVEKQEEAVVAVDTGRPRTSFTESDQILRTSSLWAIWDNNTRENDKCCWFIQFIGILVRKCKRA